MVWQAREPDQRSRAEVDIRPGQHLRRLREDPLDAVNRIAGEIGPRRATSLAEAQAAAYLDGRLRRAGFRVSADPFRAPGSVGVDGLVLATLALASATLYYWLPLPSLSLALWSLAIAAVGLGQDGVPLLARRRPSQNVIATRATAQPRWRVVLLAPLDSPLLMGRLARLLGDDVWPVLGRLVACVLLTLFALAGLLDVRRGWWYAQFVPAAYLTLVAIVDVWLLRAPATPGAISHAGALAVLLASAEELSGLQQTELWAVALGATSSSTGIGDLLRRYPFDRETTLFIGLEGIGRGVLSYVTRAGLLGRHAADPLLVQMAAAADANDPLIDAEPRSYGRERTIVQPLQRSGRRALLIACLGPDGAIPCQGHRSDTPEVVDARILDRATRLVVGLVRQIDTTDVD
jgi:hypothetical protein